MLAYPDGGRTEASGIIQPAYSQHAIARINRTQLGGSGMAVPPPVEAIDRPDVLS